MSDALAVELILRGRAIESEPDALLAAAASPGSVTILVNNEVGLEIVPVNALARALRNMAGKINQRVAAVANHVHSTAADRSTRPK